MKNDLCLKSNTPYYDSFDRKFRQMHEDILDGTRTDITHEEVSAMYQKEYAESCEFPMDVPPPPKPRVPTDEKVAMGRTRDSVTGDVREPECGFQSKYGENV